ncbi:amidase signature domain-containing protein [Penicillium mononematosum]|uniref:amidase signature domain-containing protein n=1 Tax=Penicillium mononematosum TaxID=268346 RepID=UPI002546F1ED|nr:amidase signature domain-containing protein [Penicillium mononematosum]KAJ6189727.1 amidase signature domain-containing protein [Penicillium mononematosum]
MTHIELSQRLSSRSSTREHAMECKSLYSGSCVICRRHISGCLSVAIPPRPASARPLSRLRLRVKDCYLLEGLKTSLCYNYDFSNPAPFTAETVQLLIKLRAVVLGLTKLSSMFGRKEPTEAVEFHIAFNPRGDGYQSPASGSNGSATCAAAYAWIDCAIGTDTSGSGRHPAMAMEFGNFDLSRILYTRSLKAISPPGTPDDVDGYLIDTVTRAYYYAYYHSFAAFREKYAEKHNGEPPYVILSLQCRWEIGGAVSEEQPKYAVQRMDTYKEWPLNAMLAEYTSKAEPLVARPIADAAPSYMDEPS